MIDDPRSYWVLYRDHTEPTFLEDAGGGQELQRDHSLGYVKSWHGCIDIGSNIGQWTRPLAEKFEKVYCFEPNPNFRECFNRNIHQSNVELFPYGLSDSEHMAHQEFSSTQIETGDGDIQCRTLDSFGLTDIDFVKIDVDGSEIPLLNGARKTLTQNTPVINIEMKRDKRPDTVKVAERILKDLGYRFVERTKSDEVWLKK